LFLLVLRLLAVYFATCALCLFLATRFVSRIRPGVALLLAFGPFLLTGKALLTAGVYAPLDIAYQGQPLASHRAEQGIGPTRSPILGDVVFQEIPWRKAVREAVKNGRLPLWNPLTRLRAISADRRGREATGACAAGPSAGRLAALVAAWRPPADPGRRFAPGMRVGSPAAV